MSQNVLLGDDAQQAAVVRHQRLAEAKLPGIRHSRRGHAILDEIITLEDIKIKNDGTSRSRFKF